ncbi:MAG: undecaprenyl-phosphate 4-deoxy-4-formamido-L-arabinose transferase [uncultured bacterium]|nr:MAG: undecaprenyl-phosphate 4-deoxy-4-formamido-L-arabinose transferase [uncultured bacterium]
MKETTDISIVIPAKNEDQSIPLLYKEITKNLVSITKKYEILFINDGSTDNTLEILKKLRDKDKKVKIINLRGGFGKSIALKTGFENSLGDIVITMDADLQDNPADIKKLLNKLHEGYDIVSGWKKIRYDPISKTLPSKIGNTLTRTLTGIKIHDLNCGFKAYKRYVLKHIKLYGELYKYIPVLAEKQNFRVGEVIVTHQSRKFGKSKFGWERNIKGFLDMLTIVFITGYLKRPAHFFGTWGLLFLTSGFGIGLYISFLRITTGTIQYRYPLLFLGMLLMIIGVQLISTGLLAEMMVHSSEQTSTDDYISEKLI